VSRCPLPIHDAGRRVGTDRRQAQTITRTVYWRPRPHSAPSRDCMPHIPVKIVLRRHPSHCSFTAAARRRRNWRATGRVRGQVLPSIHRAPIGCSAAGRRRIAPVLSYQLLPAPAAGVQEEPARAREDPGVPSTVCLPLLCPIQLRVLQWAARGC
jgi:hypothetical protein